MVKEIVKDEEFLKRQSIEFDHKSKSQQQVITDLLDTAKAHEENCLGLAAVQIGYLVKAFVVKNPKNNKFQLYINPLIVKRSTETFETEEGCLSLEGTRKVRRHLWIDIMYNVGKRVVKEHLVGLKAEIFQHEYDHLYGKLI